MRAVIQRVKQASVTVDGAVTGSIERGLLVLVGVHPEDTPADGARLAAKVARLRLWPDAAGTTQWRRAVADVGGRVLCVSQFTLYARVHKGTKPDFHAAARGQFARDAYDAVRAELAKLLPNGAADVADGAFGEMMDVALVNDGPVTITFDTRGQGAEWDEPPAEADAAGTGAAAASDAA